MWGSILTEANTLTNFNFGFSTYKSDILLHLSQWQYWWWFWFSLVWSIYFFLIIRLVNKRTFTFNPIMNTSIRGHGKWGDFLVALIPLSWCGNILVNSNFILRMIEWQNESSLFTIRVQGKQWYWVYKFDAAAAQSIFSAPKNIGHNRWFVTTPVESYCFDTYYQALNLGTQLEFRSLYYKYLSDDGLTKNKLNLESLQTNNESFSRTNINTVSNNKLFILPQWFNLSSFLKEKNSINNLSNFTLLNTKKLNLSILNKDDSLSMITQHFLLTRNLHSNGFIKGHSFYDFDQLDDLSNFAANVAQQNSPQPLTFIRGTLNKHNIELLKSVSNAIHFVDVDKQHLFDILKKRINKLQEIPYYRRRLSKRVIYKMTEKDLQRRANGVKVKEPVQPKILKISEKSIKNFKQIYLSKLKTVLNTSWEITKFSTLNVNLNSLPKPIYLNILFNTNSSVVEKIEDNELLWGFRQKKYKRFKKFFFNKGQTYDPKTLEPIKVVQSNSRQFKNTLVSNVGVGKKVDDLNYHNAIKYNKHRNELVPVNLAKRLLRVKRTLVLPAHVNITLISNSYDVVHSWFIPGLGLKIDCVPGRSTHHTFYIDNIGFYYGQCAEICGRYHHHMPIRLCALPFEHFLVWWQKKGLRRLHRFSSLKQPSLEKSTILNSTSGTKL